MKVICISGKAGHGKDTLAQMMEEALVQSGHRVLIAHYADLVKYVCKTFFGWDGQKDERGRQLLQRVGTDIVREKSPDYWVNFIASMLNFFGDDWDFCIIPDTRFPNEIEVLQAFGFDVMSIRVIRSGYNSSMTPEQLQHSSETALDDWSFDVTVSNDYDLKSLRKSANIISDALTGDYEEGGIQ